MRHATLSPSDVIDKPPTKMFRFYIFSKHRFLIRTAVESSFRNGPPTITHWNLTKKRLYDLNRIRTRNRMQSSHKHTNLPRKRNWFVCQPNHSWSNFEQIFKPSRFTRQRNQAEIHRANGGEFKVLPIFFTEVRVNHLGASKRCPHRDMYVMPLIPQILV